MIITPAHPDDLTTLLAFRKEAAGWLSELGSDQWSRPYPADRLLATIQAGTVFMVRDGDTTAATITLTTTGGGRTVYSRRTARTIGVRQQAHSRANPCRQKPRR